jgi:hypothetical protein
MTAALRPHIIPNSAFGCVPEGLLTIAQRFSVGKPVPGPSSPVRTAEGRCPGVWATTRPNRSRLGSLASSGGEGWGEEASFHMSSKLGASGGSVRGFGLC